MKARYKQTEVGVIPNDWDVVCLGEYTTKVGSGITPTGGEKVYKDAGRPFLRSQNVGWGHLILEEVAFIDEDTHKSFNATELALHDILLNITGASIGRSAIADERIVSGNVNQHVCIIRTKQNFLLPRFLNFTLLSNLGQKQIESFQAGGNRQGLNFGQIRSFQIALPPTIAEQTAIATVLSDTDELIQSLEKLIAKKRLIKQGTMQELLTGKRRLPGFESEWDVKPLLECCDLLQGLTYGPSNIQSHGLLVLRSSNIQDGQLAFDDCVYVNCSIDDIKYVKPNDILICVRNGSIALIGKSCVIDKKYNATFGAFMSVLRGDTTGYLAYIFASDVVQQQIRNRSSATINQITKSDFEDIKIPIPNEAEEQTAIAVILSDMDAEIAALGAKLNKYRRFKQGMMQELLTGRIRLV